jgi:hypothetical protein
MGLQKLESIGLLDAELPAYCRKQVDKSPVIKNYKFFVKEKPHAHWYGFMCKTWMKKKDRWILFWWI